MPLSPQTLAGELESQWFGGDPSSVDDAAARLADVISTWFATASALSIPCATASVRAPQLRASLIPALATGEANASGTAVALAISGYLTGQIFGTGVAAAPTALAPASTDLRQLFTDLDMSVHSRAGLFARALMTLVASTIVTFTSPVASGPIT